ncbi:restriction endonuclease subunit S [Salinivibrio sp. VYel6]|uniref:restriction endonuclease subunit S n=1 Tax=Salinivibrio sp. VYel6 TaxID=2490493 RepID=UPI00128BA1A9|nr:restriction endonuclease subunit S [Salinivibrio sp. VYel6]MPX97526.1 restriction endonuclease subunit S [Salinivibrio sp. VYel6]
MKIKQYKRVINSGIRWLSDVPVHWQLGKVKNMASLTPRKPRLSTLGDKKCSFLPMEKLKLGVIKLDEERPISEVYDGYTYFTNGDVLIAKVTPCFENKNMALAQGLTNGIGFGSSEIYVLRPKSSSTGRYLLYRLQEDEFMRIATSEMTGAGGLKRVPSDFLLNFKVAIPPIQEQQKIAQFLDYETAKIDALIEEQKWLIELLKEKRQAVISHAVTKGLNPDAPMKDSGVEWLGQVPDHWKVGRLKNHLRLKNGQDYKTVETESADGFPVIGSGGQFTKATKFLHNGESVLLGRKGTIDKPLYINGKFWTVDTMFYSEVFKSSSAKYVYYLAMTVPFSLYSTNTALPSMSQSDLHNHITVIPPLVEQSEIANYIDEQLEKLDRLSDRLLTNSKLLQERRSALISAAVTGKIDVRDWQQPEDAGSIDSNAAVQTERQDG